MADKKNDATLDRLINAIKNCDASAISRAVEDLDNPQMSTTLDSAATLKAVKDASEAGYCSVVRAVASEFAEKLRDDFIEHPRTFASELAAAVDAFDNDKVADLCRRCVRYHQGSSAPYPLAVQESILASLQRKRYFSHMLSVGDTFVLCNGSVKPKDDKDTKTGKLRVRRRYAQALIDSGQLAAALTFLESLETACRTHKINRELAEALGLIGRVHKQYYVNATAGDNKPSAAHKRSLSDAVSTYGEVYDGGKENVWQGINAAALISRAQRDKVRLSGNKRTTEEIASRVLRDISGRTSDYNLWDFAVGVEANLGLGKYKDALQWLNKYVSAEGADAFEYASTLRQFEEVWQLDPADSDQAKILQLLRSALLRQDGGGVVIQNLSREIASAGKIVSDKKYEAILGEDRYKTYNWYVMGLERATSVGKVVNRVGDGIGTGFLLKGSDIHPTITEDWVFLTNAHVISDDPQEQSGTPRSLDPDDAVVVFQAGPDAGKTFEIDRLIFTSRRNDLDCTIATLAQATSFDAPTRVSKSLPRLSAGKNHRVFVIGHPKGGSLSFSLHDNILLDHQSPKIHYRAPTEGGSSGSPVFNSTWSLIGIHHLGGESVQKLNNQSGFYEANEGISIQSIRNAVAARFG